MSETRETLLALLERYQGEGHVPFHMPGHKRNIKLAHYLERLGANLDLTEIPGFDDLHHPEGILAEAMTRTARLWGSDKAFFLINGSTGGLLAGIRAATKYGDRVLVARNCHKAVYHALELCGLQPVFLKPPEVPGFGCFGSLPPEMVEEALSMNLEIRLVILTSPTYEGVISDVEAICALAHHRKIPVLVDEAHGAHLGLDETFPVGAISCGADLVVQSFHKTLPSLTQTGVLHVKSDLISPEEVARQLGIFQSSSPSYLFLASLEGCVSLLEKERTSLFGAWKKRLLKVEKNLQTLKGLQILGHGENKEPQHVFRLDPGKLVIGTKSKAFTGVRLMEILQKEYRIQLEMALIQYAVAMTGMGDTSHMMEQFTKALLEVDALYPGETDAFFDMMDTKLPEIHMTQSEAVRYPWKLVSAQEGEGLICGEAIWAYPPGVPLIVPGEVFSRELIRQLLQMSEAGVRLCGTRATPPITLTVLI